MHPCMLVHTHTHIHTHTHTHICKMDNFDNFFDFLPTVSILVKEWEHEAIFSIRGSGGCNSVAAKKMPLSCIPFYFWKSSN